MNIEKTASEKTKLIALDVDGTLRSSAGVITPPTMETLNKLHEEGVIIVIATGRSMSELAEERARLPFIRFFITGNGSLVYDAERKCDIYENKIPFSVVESLIPGLKEIDFLLNIYAEHLVYTGAEAWNRAGDYHADFIRKWTYESRTSVPDIYQFLYEYHQPIEKILLFFKNKTDQNKVIRLCRGKGLSLFVTEHIEINNSFCTKGNALQALCSYLRISAEQTAAVGDSRNDVEMLQFAGKSAAMKNAEPEALAAADFITESNDKDGIALFAEQNILKSS